MVTTRNLPALSSIWESVEIGPPDGVLTSAIPMFRMCRLMEFAPQQACVCVCNRHVEVLSFGDLQLAEVGIDRTGKLYMIC